MVFEKAPRELRGAFRGGWGAEEAASGFGSGSVPVRVGSHGYDASRRLASALRSARASGALSPFETSIAD